MEAKNKEFKDTEIGRIPKEWKVVRLGDAEIAEIRHNRRVNGFEKVAFIPMELIPESGIFCKYEIRPINEVKSFTYCERGDLLLAKITPSLENGKQGIVPDDVLNGFALATTEVFPLLPKGVDRLFLFYLLKFSKFRNRIIASMIGTTGRQRASKESVENLKIPLPPLPEQRKIAEILSTVDEAIQKVDEAIQRTERLKRGLMQRLLTQGIGHKEFKDNEIGRIPKEWEVVRLKEITLPTENIDPKSKTEKEFKYVDITGIENLAITSWSLIKSNNAPSRARRLIKAKDVIFATTRPYLKNVAIVPEELDGQICSTGFCVIRPNEKFTISEWIFYNILTERFISRISSKMKGATYPAVSDKDVLEEKIPLPPLSEQRRIAEILSTVDKKIELERKRKEKLERIKRGLMNDLLTGRKRVRT